MFSPALLLFRISRDYTREKYLFSIPDRTLSIRRPIASSPHRIDNHGALDGNRRVVIIFKPLVKHCSTFKISTPLFSRTKRPLEQSLRQFYLPFLSFSAIQYLRVVKSGKIQRAAWTDSNAGSSGTYYVMLYYVIAVIALAQDTDFTENIQQLGTKNK